MDSLNPLKQHRIFVRLAESKEWLSEKSFSKERIFKHLHKGSIGTCEVNRSGTGDRETIFYKPGE